MKRKSASEKLDKKRAAWVQRTAVVLDIDESAAIELLQTKRRQSLRLNPLKGDEKATLAELKGEGWLGSAYAWCENGFTIDSEAGTVRDSRAVEGGRAFIQNAASWLPVIALDPRPNESVLDICAAPGGKTSHVAAMTNNTAMIWANDNSRPRLAKLQSNMKRLGAVIEQYTLYDATALSRKLDGQQFDKILLDAPCSGEGLMNYDRDADYATWSVAHIKRLQQLQKKIISQAWQLLKPGGTLVYSTCTMAPEEDEAVVDYLLRSQTDVKVVPLTLQLPNRVNTVVEWNGKAYSPDIKGCMRLKPSEDIEAFFVCKLRKIGISD